MQQWEYCELRLDISGTVMIRQSVRFYQVEGPSREIIVSSRDQAIAELGLAGWEMVGVAGSLMQDGGGLSLFFKRPLPSSDETSAPSGVEARSRVPLPADPSEENDDADTPHTPVLD